MPIKRPLTVPGGVTPTRCSDGSACRRSRDRSGSRFNRAPASRRSRLRPEPLLAPALVTFPRASGTSRQLERGDDGVRAALEGDEVWRRWRPVARRVRCLRGGPV